MLSTQKLLPALFVIALLASCDDNDAPLTEPLTETEAADVAGRIQSLVSGQALLQTGYEQTQISARQEDDLTKSKDDWRPLTKNTDCPAVDFVADGTDFFPALLTLTYGADCTDAELDSLGGIIRATFNGLLFSPGTNIGIEFEDFSVGDYTASGLYRVTNDSLDAQGRQSFGHLISDGELSLRDTFLFTYQEEATTYQVAGQETNFFNAGLEGILDDRFERQFTGTGVFADGDAFTITSLTPITHAFGCDYPTAGQISYELEGLDAPILLDFGQGECDNLATLTVGGWSFGVEL